MVNTMTTTRNQPVSYLADGRVSRFAEPGVYVSPATNLTEVDASEGWFRDARDRFLVVLGESADAIDPGTPPFTEEQIRVLYDLGMLDGLY